MSDQPEYGKTYSLIGGNDQPSIANGDGWKASEIDMDKLAADLAAKKRKQLLEALSED
jgi:hypothetical protein